MKRLHVIALRLNELQELRRQIDAEWDALMLERQQLEENDPP